MTAESKDKDPTPNAAPVDATTGEFQELRSLLLRPEHEELDALKRQLSRRTDVDAKSVAAVLPAAITLATDKADKLGQAMGPTIENALKLSVRRNPEVITEAIFPIIGGAISRAVREALLRLLQQTSYALDHSFSLRGWKWRIEALATGKPFSEVVLLHSLVYRVEQVFLIHPESGLLLQHVISDAVAASIGQDAQDASMVTSMLTAIQDFVRDSFRVESKAALDSVEIGDLTVWLERGPHAVLAGVIRGTAPMSLRSVFRSALELCHREALDLMKSFSGDTDDLKGVRPYLDSCLQVHQKTEERSHLSTWLIFATLLFTFGYFIHNQIMTERKHTAQLAYAAGVLQNQEGVVLLEASTKDGSYHLRLMRDPEAPTETEILDRTRLPTEQTEAHFTPYLSTDQSLVLRRAHRTLVPPAGVELSYNQRDGVLFSNGIASAEWIKDAKLLAPVIAGVRRFDCQTQAPIPPKPLYDVLTEKAHVIEAIEFKFRAGSVDLLPGQEPQLVRAVAEMKELLRLAEADHTGMEITIEVHAYTDRIGTEEYNQKLREARAKEMSLWLGNAGVDAQRLKAVAPTAQQLERIDRAASFRVVIGSGRSAKEDAR